MKRIILIFCALALAVPAVALANYLQASTAREYLWGWYGHDPDVQTKRAAIERVYDVNIVDTELVQAGYHPNNDDHHVVAVWRFWRACAPGCGPDDNGWTGDYYTRGFEAYLGHYNSLVSDGPLVPN